MAQGFSEELSGVSVRVTMQMADFLGRNTLALLSVISQKIKDAPTVQSVKALAKSKSALDSVPVEANKLGDFIKECGKMGVKVAVVKDPENSDNVNIIFRAGQTPLIENAIAKFQFERFSDNNMVQYENKSTKKTDVRYKIKSNTIKNPIVEGNSPDVKEGVKAKLERAIKAAAEQVLSQPQERTHNQRRGAL